MSKNSVFLYRRSARALAMRRLERHGINVVVMALSAVVTDQHPDEIARLAQILQHENPGAQLATYFEELPTRHARDVLMAWVRSVHDLLDMVEEGQPVVIDEITLAPGDFISAIAPLRA